jgi:hypothetical protein
MTSIATISIAIAAGLVLGLIAGWTICDAHVAASAFRATWPPATPRQVRRAARRNRADLRAMLGDRP